MKCSQNRSFLPISHQHLLLPPCEKWGFSMAVIKKCRGIWLFGRVQFVETITVGPPNTKIPTKSVRSSHSFSLTPPLFRKAAISAAWTPFDAPGSCFSGKDPDFVWGYNLKCGFKTTWSQILMEERSVGSNAKRWYILWILRQSQRGEMFDSCDFQEVYIQNIYFWYPKSTPEQIFPS